MKPSGIPEAELRLPTPNSENVAKRSFALKPKPSNAHEETFKEILEKRMPTPCVQLLQPNRYSWPMSRTSLSGVDMAMNR